MARLPLAACRPSAFETAPLWAGEMADWGRSSQGAVYQFGESNTSCEAGGLRAFYPAGAYDPSAVRRAGEPLGGAQFRTPFNRMNVAAADEIGLRYQMALAGWHWLTTLTLCAAATTRLTRAAPLTVIHTRRAQTTPACSPRQGPTNFKSSK